MEVWEGGGQWCVGLRMYTIIWVMSSKTLSETNCIRKLLKGSKMGVLPRGTNHKIPASQPTQRGRGVMVLEREMWH